MKKLALIATISIMLALMATSIVSVSPVSALTVAFRPSGDVTTGLTIGGSAPAITNWESVDEETSDGDVTWVACTANTVTWEEDLYNLSDTTSAPGKINSVTVWINARAEKAATETCAYTIIKTGGTPYNGTAETLTAAWLTYSTAYPTNPQTTNEWTWAEVNALQAGVGLKRPTAGKTSYCTQVWVVVDYMPATFESYKTVAHSIIWGSEAEQYDSDFPTAYMYGDNFTANHAYHVAYYDATAEGTQIKSDGTTSSGNILSYDCDLSYNIGATAGLWHAVVFDDDLGSPPSTYNACSGTAGYVVEDSFWVAQSAIPEFPTIMAAIGVAGLCFGIYYWMRKRRLAYVKG